jgi:hypothetical protein
MTWLKAKNNEKSSEAHVQRTQRWRKKQKEMTIADGTYRPRGWNGGRRKGKNVVDTLSPQWH